MTSPLEKTNDELTNEQKVDAYNRVILDIVSGKIKVPYPVDDEDEE